MSGNRSLDEFAEAGPGGAEPSDDGDGAAAADGTTDADGATDADGTTGVDEVSDASPGAGETSDQPDPDATGPPASTYTWAPDGAPCAACGTAVEERWRDGDDLVCAGCKEW